MDKQFSYEKLSDSIFVCVSKEHRFGTDAFLLADFAHPRHKDLVCDLGTGCGIIPMAIERDFSPKQIFGVDIQPLAIEQFEMSVEKSGKADKIVPICADLKQLHDIGFGQFDVVTCNPPYFTNGAGILSDTDSDKIARHETMCSMQDVCDCASKLLKFGGKLCVCQRPERIMDVLFAMRQSGIEPKYIQFVAKNEKTQPWLVLVEGKKGSKPYLTVKESRFVGNGDIFSK